MFDVSFTEMMVIAVVALVVIGPERLPKVARTLGHMLGRLQRYVSEVKADINRELELEELRKFRQQVETQARDFETSVNREARSTESALQAAFADRPAEAAQRPEAAPPAAGAQSPQLDLGLESGPPRPEPGPDSRA